MQVISVHNTNEIKPHLKLEKTFNNLNWILIHQIPFKCTIDTKIRCFQYKCIMRILPTNTFLFKCNIINSSLCDFFCDRYPETFEHLFMHYVRSFWTQIHNYCIVNNHPFNIHVGYQQLSFGLTNAPNNNLLNCIILIAKYFIFKNKMTKTIPSIESFLLYVQKTKQIERIIAINKNKLRIHEIKWQQM